MSTIKIALILLGFPLGVLYIVTIVCFCIEIINDTLWEVFNIDLRTIIKRRKNE